MACADAQDQGGGTPADHALGVRQAGRGGGERSEVVMVQFEGC